MIRDATKADANAIAEIYNHYIKNTAVTFEEDEVSFDEICRRIQQTQVMGYTWLIALQDEKVVGYACSGKWNMRSAYRNTAEISVYLEQSATSQGYGTALYDAMFAQLRKKGVHVVIGCITLPNPSSVALPSPSLPERWITRIRASTFVRSSHHSPVPSGELSSTTRRSTSGAY